MTNKRAPIGICDHCGGPILHESWYTSKGKQRMYCSRDCRNAGNSQAGEPVRYEKMMDRIQRGEWINPNEIHPPTSEEQAARARKGRLREIAEGRWRNPALAAEARAKLSKPRVHTGNLASAIEKLDAGAKISELTTEEQEAHRAWRRSLVAARRAEFNRKARERYKRKKA